MGRRSTIEKYEEHTTGQIRVGTSESNGPTVDAKLVKLKAASANAGNVYFSFETGIQALQAATDPDVGWELAAGDETPWIFVDNLDDIFLVADAADQDLVYWVRT